MALYLWLDNTNSPYNLSGRSTHKVVCLVVMDVMRGLYNITHSTISPMGLWYLSLYAFDSIFPQMQGCNVNHTYTLSL